MRVDLHPEARAEFRSGALWYAERRDGLGEEFVAAVDEVLLRIAKAPKSFPRWTGTEKAAAVIRKAPVERFPYVIAFEEHKRHVLVLAVAHQKRRPNSLMVVERGRKARGYELTLSFRESSEANAVFP